MQSFIELIRRLLSVACILYGVWCFFTPGPEMLLIELENFEKSFDRDPYFKPKGTTLEDFKNERLKDRVFVVSQTEWKAIFETVKSGRKGKANQILRGGNAYWLHDVPQYDRNWPNFIYLNPEGTKDYFSVDRDFPLDIYGIDRSKVYPNRQLGLWLILACFIIYIILPRAKRLPERIYYAKSASIILPDLLGLIGAAFFFAIPILVINENNPGHLPWDSDGGWWMLTAAFFVMAALFLSMVFIANHYSTLYFEITPSALLINRRSNKTGYSWADIESCEPYVGKRGRVIGILLIIFGRTPGQVGQGLLVATNEEYGVELKLKNTKKLRIMFNYLNGIDKIMDALKSHKIHGSEDMDC